MKQVILGFTTHLMLSDFVLSNRIYKVMIDTSQLTVTGILFDEQIELACKQYNAQVVKADPVQLEN